MISKESVTNDILDVLKHQEKKQASKFTIIEELAPIYPMKEVEVGIKKLKKMELIELDENKKNLRIPNDLKEKASSKLKDYFKDMDG